jgi:hypothetical protein
MAEIVYIPAIIKMANTKFERCRGRQGAKLRALIAAAEAADNTMMGFRQPCSLDPTFISAVHAADAAGKALLSFAGSL